jgi:hypothetical protein
MDQFTDEIVLFAPGTALNLSPPEMHSSDEEHGDGVPLDADTGATYGATCVIS